MTPFLLLTLTTLFSLPYGKCEALPPQDLAQIPPLNNWCQKPAQLEGVPIHLTNYWPFDENNSLMEGFNGQCDEDCSVTANGTQVTLEIAQGNHGACPLPMIYRYNPLYIYVEGYGTIACIDTFGNKHYQKGIFWHDRRKTWVWAVDILTKNPTYDLVFEWEILGFTPKRKKAMIKLKIDGLDQIETTLAKRERALNTEWPHHMAQTIATKGQTEYERVLRQLRLGGDKQPSIKKSVSKAKFLVEMFLDNKAWNILDRGSPPHVIRAKTSKGLTFIVGGFAPKTTPNLLKVTSGQKAHKNLIQGIMSVNHPGFAPREFSYSIFTLVEKFMLKGHKQAMHRFMTL